jgi:hypothetical protein
LDTAGGRGNPGTAQILPPQLYMTTKLDKALKREIVVDDRAYTVTLTAEGVKVVEKGKRNGQEVSWKSIVTGDTQLAESLNLSVDATETTPN